MKRAVRHERPELRSDFDDAVRRFFDSQTSEFLERFGAVGLGLGFKVKGRVVQRRLSLRLYVEKKTAPGQTPPNAEKLQEFWRVACDGGDDLQIPTDVEESSIAVPHQPPRGAGGAFSPTDRVRPLVGGVQISPIDSRDTDIGVGLGTLGGWAWDRKNRQVVLVSNAHVLGRHDGSSRVAIIQPSNKKTAVIGTLLGSAGYFGDGTNTVDVAVGGLDDMRHVDMTVHDIGPAIMASAEPEQHQRVEKFGVTTGRTFGRVTNKYWFGHLETGPIGGKDTERKFFKRCIRIEARQKRSEAWADHGDSGALVFASQTLPGSRVKPVIGVHFAGPRNTARAGYACRISEVYRALDLSSLADGAVSIALTAAGLHETGQDDARRALQEFMAAVPADGEASALHGLVTRHLDQITAIVVRDDDRTVRTGIGRMLRPLLGDGQSLGTISRTELTADLVRDIGDVCRMLDERSKSRTFKKALAAFHDWLVANQGRSVGEAFAFGTTPVHAAASGHAPSNDLTADDIASYLDEHGEELLERFGGVAAEPYQHSATTHGIQLTREPGVASTSTLPPVIPWNRNGLTVNIPLRESIGDVAVRK